MLHQFAELEYLETINDAESSIDKTNSVYFQTMDTIGGMTPTMPLGLITPMFDKLTWIRAMGYGHKWLEKLHEEDLKRLCREHYQPSPLPPVTSPPPPVLFPGLPPIYPERK